MKILVSACLLGRSCKYSGGNNLNAKVVDFVQGHEIIEVCPEVAAGLGIPRTPIEIVDGVLTDRNGNSVDAALREAVAEILSKLPRDIDCAILQSRSPTCGVNQIYDGTFSGKRIPGSGVFAQALKEAGYRVLDAEDIPGTFSKTDSPDVEAAWIRLMEEVQRGWATVQDESSWIDQEQAYRLLGLDSSV